MVPSVFLRSRLLLAVALFVGSACGQTTLVITGQQASTDDQISESGDLVFRQSVRRVIVDVVVSDANGKPVSGLSAGDFSIAEDGKPERVRSFDVHDFDSVSDSLPEHPAFLPTNTFVNVPSGPERGLAVRSAG